MSAPARSFNLVPLLLALSLVTVAGLWVYWESSQTPKLPRVTLTSTISASSQSVAPPPASVASSLPQIDTSSSLSQPTEALTPAEPLPKLDSSDTPVSADLLTLSDGSVQSWLVNEHLIRKFVRAINALEEGKLVDQFRPFKPATTAFKVEASGDLWRVHEENYARYWPYISSLEHLGAEKLVRFYVKYYPLLQQAHEELGVNKGDFKSVTHRALQRLVNTPIPNRTLLLEHPGVVYKFAAPDLEQRSAVEKLFYRLGEENSQKIKALAASALSQF